ncbi:MAG: DUF3429 domain-containing protein [Accumulibacter sp.]|uniref:DUF3429 domain-containing protein n=1 Tax=Accumulibacter sp. TaxID=2053492 RepID=UPI002FC27EA2
MDHPHPEPLARRVAWLGYGGLLPFLVLASASLGNAQHAQLRNEARLAYATVIPSFVGALHWGFAMTRDLRASLRTWRFVWSIVPALLAWSTLWRSVFWSCTGRRC